MSDFERDMVVSRELEDGIQLQQPNFIQDTVVQSLSSQFDFEDGFTDDGKYDIQKEDIRNIVDEESKTIKNERFRINDVNYADLKNGVSPNRLRTSAFEDIYTIRVDNGSRVCVRSEDCILTDLSDHSLLDGYLHVHTDNPSILEEHDSFTLSKTEDGLVMEADNNQKRYLRLGLTASGALLAPIAWFLGVVQPWIMFCLLIFSFLLIDEMNRKDMETAFKAEFVEEESVVLKDVDVQAQEVVRFNIRETDDGITLESDNVDHVWSIQKEDGVYPSEVIELFESIGFDTIEKESVELKIIRDYDSGIQGLESDDGNWLIPMDQSERTVAESNSTDKSLELA